MLTEHAKTQIVDCKEIKTSKSKYSLLNPIQFQKQLRMDIRNAERRIWIKMMDYDSGHLSDPITEEFKNAGSNSNTENMSRRLVLDPFVRLVCKDKLFGIPTTNDHQRLLERRKIETLDGLKTSGVNVEILEEKGIQNRLPFWGRDHRKIIIIDDCAYVGGMNITDCIFRERLDYMVRTEDPDVVEKLLDEFDNSSTEDHKVKCNEHTSLIIDGGRMFSSLIYNEAVILVRNAQERIVYLSGYLPYREMAEVINERARAGVESEVFRPGQRSILNGICGIFKTGLVEPVLTYKIPDWDIHAKILLVDHSLLIGSHNLTPISQCAGGTRELSILTTERELISQAEEIFSNLRNSEGL